MKLNKYFSTLLGGLVLFGAWSCTDKIEPTPTPAYDGADVYFSTTQSTDVNIPMDASQVSVSIYRVKADAEQTVNLSTTFTVQDEEGNYVSAADIFTAPETVTFAKDEKTTQIAVDVDFSKVVAGEDYYMHIVIDGDLTSSYGDAEKTFVLNYSQWSEWEWFENPSTLVTWNINGPLSDAGEAGNLSPADLEDSMDEDGDYIMLYYGGQIVKRHSLINPDLTMIGVGGSRYSNFHFNLIYTIDNSEMVTVNGQQYPVVTMEGFDSGYDNDGDEIFIYDCRGFLAELGYVPGTAAYQQKWKDWGMMESYYDPTTGIIHYYPVYLSGTSFWSPKESFVYLPGFEDYSFNFSYMGNFVTSAGTENAVINISHGDGVHSFVYGYQMGALSDEQVNEFAAELAADTDLELIYEDSYDVMLPLTEEGDYTLVTVAYDQAGSPISNSYFVFNFKSVQKESMWESVGIGGFTDDISTAMFNNAQIDTYEVEIEQHKETPGLYRIVQPFVDLYAIDGINPTGDPGYIYFNISNPNAVYILESPVGFSCEPMFGTNEPAMLIDQAEDMDDETMISTGCNGVLEDGVITFPSTFKYNGKDYYALLLSVESLWKDGKALGVNRDGATEIYMPDGADYAHVKKAPSRSNKNLTLRKITTADRGYLNTAKRKAAKVAKREAELKKFHESLLNTAKSIR